MKDIGFVCYTSYMVDDHFNDDDMTSESEDVDFEPNEELGDMGAAKAKLKKIKDELAQVKEERQQYLDGWQRAKADMANYKKDAQQSADRAIERAKEKIIGDILPVLDSFDMATGTEAWESMDSQWKSGIDSIRNQLLDMLHKNGVERFGKVGEQVDFRLHEVVQEMHDVAGESHSIVRVLRAGYVMGDIIIRPAQVIIKG